MKFITILFIYVTFELLGITGDEENITSIWNQKTSENTNYNKGVLN